MAHAPYTFVRRTRPGFGMFIRHPQLKYETIEHLGKTVVRTRRGGSTTVEMPISRDRLSTAGRKHFGV